jgi:pimeloyl-ACP methyl ester carboxylesterase
VPAVAEVEQERTSGIAYREALPSSDSGLNPLLCVHGFPESSYMWEAVLRTVADSGRRAIALDLPGFGDSPADPPGTWERQVEALERFRQALGLERVALAVHDWGGLIGLRWACDNPGAASALVVSDTGFFPDGKWHGAADVMRTPGDGEKLIDGFDRAAFEGMMRSQSEGFDDEAIAHYWKAFESEDGRRGVLELYRSGDFSKLEAYEGGLTALDLPMLALWGENDPFAPVAGAYRFRKELPETEIVVVDGSGHFVFADDPERSAREVARFLSGLD